MRRMMLCSAAMLLAAWVPANAHLIALDDPLLTGQGFGNTLNLLTLQNPPGTTTESGQVAPSATGTVTATGTGLVSPIDGTKYSVPTLSQLGWNSAADVKVLLNAAEPGNATGVTIDQLTLSFYNGTTPIASISNQGPLSLSSTVTGVGGAGWLIGVSPDEYPLLAAVFGANPANIRLGISSSLSDVAAGPDTFSAVVGGTVSAVPLSAVPLPPAALLFGGGLAGLGALKLKRRRRQVLSAA
jgi:hypothetical protein